MKKEISDLIARGRTDLAIKKLLEFTKDRKGEYGEATIISNRYQNFSKSVRSNILRQEEQNIALVKINTSILNLINDDSKNKTVLPTTIKKTLFKWITIAGVFLAVSAGIAEFLKDLMPRSVETLSVTVLVHGKKGKDERIITNEGKVVLYVGDVIKEETINSKGEATFKGLANYRGKKAIVSLYHPQPYLPVIRDTQYTISEGTSIYLEVELKGLEFVEGEIINYTTEEPLDNVRVSFKGEATFSDEFGYYKLQIPDSMQSKFIDLTFYKKGFKRETFNNIAPHTRESINISLNPK